MTRKSSVAYYDRLPHLNTLLSQADFGTFSRLMAAAIRVDRGENVENKVIRTHYPMCESDLCRVDVVELTQFC